MTYTGGMRIVRRVAFALLAVALSSCSEKDAGLAKARAAGAAAAAAVFATPPPDPREVRTDNPKYHVVRRLTTSDGCSIFDVSGSNDANLTYVRCTGRGEQHVSTHSRHVLLLGGKVPLTRTVKTETVPTAAP